MNKIIEIEIATKKNSIQKTFWKVAAYPSQYPSINGSYWNSWQNPTLEISFNQIKETSATKSEIDYKDYVKEGAEDIVLRGKNLGEISIRFSANRSYPTIENRRGNSYPTSNLTDSEREFISENIVVKLREFIADNLSELKKEAEQIYKKSIENSLKEYLERYATLEKEGKDLIQKVSL